MASVNKVIIVGNLGRDPEIRYAPSGEAICSITVATTDSWKDKNTGEKKEQTEWHRITFFGKLGEIVSQYMKKGSSIYVEGSLRTRKYTDKDGIEKYATDIRADNMQMLGSNNGQPQGQGSQGNGQRNNAPAARQAAQRHNPNQQYQQQNGLGHMDEDDIPF